MPSNADGEARGPCVGLNVPKDEVSPETFPDGYPLPVRFGPSAFAVGMCPEKKLLTIDPSRTSACMASVSAPWSTSTTSRLSAASSVSNIMLERSLTGNLLLHSPSAQSYF